MTFDAYGNQDEVAREDVRQQEVQAEGVDLGATYRGMQRDRQRQREICCEIYGYSNFTFHFSSGVEAPKRKAVNEEQTGTEELPKWLEIKPTGKLTANFFFYTFKKNFYCLSKKSFISLIALPGIILFTFNVIVLIFQFVD